jgi:hypothetical protein
MNFTEKDAHKRLPDAMLAAFSPIALAEMEQVKLMDRVETKFVFHVSALESLMPKLIAHYDVMEHLGNRQSRYETVYFDTDDFWMYRMHHNGKANRFKLRIRRYLDTSTAYCEFKLKNHKKRTQKQRIPCSWQESEKQGFHLFEQLKVPQLAGLMGLCPSLKVNYTRITLVGKDRSERITLDIGLTTTAGTFPIRTPEICIAEVKQSGRTDSEFLQLMHHMQIAPLRISKYCLGMMIHHPSLKRNNFKPRLMQLEKIKSSVLSYKTN